MTTTTTEFEFYKRGKVRDLYTTPNNELLIVHSDRLSSFDRKICDVSGKGHILTEMTTFWFNATKNIVPNHYLKSFKNYILAKKCTVIPIEFVVRGYITGNTKTSLWTNYNISRNYCGIYFPEGLIKNQKLSEPVITPTTKGETDEPLTMQEILDRGVLNKEQLDYISRVVLELFSFGTEIARKSGYILVDTKYEFGFDSEGNILLIDEVHTCDSSRYWKLNSYQERFSNGEEPEKLDKDQIRDYVRSAISDPYKDSIPEIPESIKSQVLNTYSKLYTDLSDTKLGELVTYNEDNTRLEDHQHVYNSIKYTETKKKVIVILAGSTSDEQHVLKIKREFTREFNLVIHVHYCSAHKNTKQLLDILDYYNSSYNTKMAYITVAGRSNALSGVVACNTNRPVIACPPFKDKNDMMVNINSSLQCPSKTPVMVILEPNNVYLSVMRMFNM